jgi:hypothetical protein
MSDEIDRAQEDEQMALATARAKRKPTLKPINRCYNCDEAIRMGLFCDGDCRDDYEKWIAHNKREESK